MNGVLLALALAVQPGPQGQPVQTAMSLPPSPEQVMAIPDELRAAFHREVVDATSFPEARLQRLVSFVYADSGLGVEYKADATHTVAESFASREVNCLSSTLLIVALAREAGLVADGQQVERILTWGASGATVIQSKHVNAVVKVADKRDFVVDIDGEDLVIRDAPDPMSDSHLLALFYGNRAMELLLENRLDEADAWLAAAFRQKSDDAGLLNNAGVLSLRRGDTKTAERYFLQAVERNDVELSALSNLVALYRRLGNGGREAYWRGRADEILRQDPYYQFTLGRQHERAGDYDAAEKQYRRAIRLNRNEPRFRYGMARVHFLEGKYEKADRELMAAVKLAGGQLRGRYQDKLAALRRLDDR